MNETPTESTQKRVSVFGYPIKDYLYLFAMISAALGSYAGISGTPNQTRDAVTAQTDSFLVAFDELRSLVLINTRSSQRNVLRLDEVESFERDIISHVDSLHGITLQGLRNLDGYFRGRLDQIGPPGN